MFRPARLLVAGALVAGIAVMTLPGHAGASKTESTRTALAGYGGADLFRGLVLGSGPVAAYFPEVNRPTSGAAAEVQERLVAAIDRTSPGYFDAFAETMRSGDHNEVTDGLIRTVGALATAARDEIRNAQNGSTGNPLPPEVESQLHGLVKALAPVTNPVNDAAALLKSKVLVATKTTAIAYSESVAAVVTSYYVISWPFKQATGVAGGAGVAFDLFVDHVVTVL